MYHLPTFLATIFEILTRYFNGLEFASIATLQDKRKSLKMKIFPQFVIDKTISKNYSLQEREKENIYMSREKFVLVVFYSHAINVGWTQVYLVELGSPQQGSMHMESSNQFQITGPKIQNFKEVFLKKNPKVTKMNQLMEMKHQLNHSSWRNKFAILEQLDLETFGWFFY